MILSISVFKKFNCENRLLDVVYSRQLSFIGHILRRKSLKGTLLLEPVWCLGAEAEADLGLKLDWATTWRKTGEGLWRGGHGDSESSQPSLIMMILSMTAWSNIEKCCAHHPPVPFVAVLSAFNALLCVNWSQFFTMVLWDVFSNFRWNGISTVGFPSYFCWKWISTAVWFDRRRYTSSFTVIFHWRHLLFCSLLLCTVAE